MEYKLFESTGVEITHIDGAAFNNFSAGGENGVIAGILEECEVVLESYQTVKVSTGELLIQGFRVKITSPYTIRKPPNITNVDYYLIACVVLNNNGAVDFSIQARNDPTLTQDNLFERESGTYEIELCRFIVGSSGITNLTQTVKTISGPAGSGGGLTTEQLEQFKELVEWYNKEHYISMEASMSMSPATTTYEIGKIVPSVTFAWSFTVDGKTAQLQSLKFNGETITDLSQTTKTITNISSTKTYKVVGKRADGDQETKETSKTISFYNKYYFGFAEDPRDKVITALDGITDFSDFIKNNLKSDIGWAPKKPELNKSNVTCPDGKYMWFAYPSDFGTSNFAINGFWGNFEPPIEKTFINSQEHQESYYLYRSTQDSLGTMATLISE